MRRLVLLAFLLGSPALAAEEKPEFYEQVYLDHDHALAAALPAHDAVVPRVFTPTLEQRHALEKRLGRKLPEPSYTFYEGRQGGHAVGEALILDEMGKHFPITFVVGLTPAGAVREVAVMVYRERRGDAVRRERFLHQFEGKTAADPIMINRDVVHLTGATISSWALAAGVKKAVTLYDALGKQP